jgi:hypothetical protein
MPQPKKVIRRIAPAASSADFDEQLWPVNCALVVLAGFVSGVIVATSDFDSPRILLNGWARLASLAVILAILIGGTVYLQRRTHVRRIQFCVLVSLLLHLFLGLGLTRWYLEPYLATDDTESEWIAETEFVTLPDYGREPTNELAEQEVFEQPTPTETPDTVSRSTERQAAAEQPAMADPTADAEPGERSTAAAARSDIERTELSAPRRSEALSGIRLSRQDRPGPQPTVEQAPIDAARPAAEAAAAADAQVAPLARRANAAPTAERGSEETAPADTATDIAADVDRRSDDSSQPEARVAASAPGRAAAVRTPEEQLSLAGGGPDRGGGAKFDGRAAAGRGPGLGPSAERSAAQGRSGCAA